MTMTTIKTVSYHLTAHKIEGMQIIKYILFWSITFSTLGINAQGSDLEDKKKQQSNDFIYEGNATVDKDFVGAEMSYRKAISSNPNNATGNYNLGNAYYSSGLYDEALNRHIEAANSANTKKEKHKAFHNIGNVLMQQKQCKKAVEAYKNALRNDPTDDETRYNLALAQECANKQGEGDDGEKDQKEDQKEKDKQEQDQNKDDKKEGDNDEDKNDENQDQNDQKNNEGEDKKDENGKPKEDKNQKPQQGKLSPQQIKNLLEAMSNQEKKVQDKVNAKKVKGEKVKTEKDW